MKLKRTYCWACVLMAVLLASMSLNAQDVKAEGILNTVSEKAKGYDSVEADFISVMEDKQADLRVEQKGNILVKGEMFKLDLDDNFLLISDGTTLWSYSKESNETMVDNIEDVMDEEGIKPSELFNVWEKDFKKYYESEANVGSTPCHVIKLIPTEPKEKAFHTIKVYIDIAKNEVAQALIFGKEGNNTTYTINTFKSNVATTDGSFKFDKTKYPGVDIIDNR